MRQFHSGECADVVLGDIARRPPIKARVLVFANEKGGVGKSTLAFHCSVALARRGCKVLAIDLDRRQQSLARALESREATARSFGVTLPSPRRSLPEFHSAAMLLQEITRIGSDCDLVVIDVPGQDSPLARRAIALADVLLTPVNPNFVDLSSLARFNPASSRMTGLGNFANLVQDLRSARRKQGMPDIDWVMVRNRVRASERRQLARFDAAAAQVARKCDFRICSGLSERVAYRDLYSFGLTHEDCRLLPGLGGKQVRASGEIETLLQAMGSVVAVGQPVNRSTFVRGSEVRSLARYRDALKNHIRSSGPPAPVASAG